MSAVEPILVRIDSMPTGLVAILAIAFAGLAFIVSIISVLLARRQLRHQKIVELINQRYSIPMRLARRALGSAYDETNDQWDKKAAEDPELDEHRWVFTTYFQRIMDLKNTRLLRSREIDALVNESDMVLLLCVDGPIEKHVQDRLRTKCEEMRKLREPKKEHSYESGPSKFFADLYRNRSICKGDQEANATPTESSRSPKLE